MDLKCLGARLYEIIISAPESLHGKAPDILHAIRNSGVTGQCRDLLPMNVEALVSFNEAERGAYESLKRLSVFAFQTCILT